MTKIRADEYFLCVGLVRLKIKQVKRYAKCISHLVRAVKWGQITPIGYLSDLSVFTRQNTLTCHSGRGSQNIIVILTGTDWLVRLPKPTQLCASAGGAGLVLKFHFWLDPVVEGIFFLYCCVKLWSLAFSTTPKKIEIYEALKGSHRLLYRVCCYPCNIIFSSLVSMNLISTNQCS